MKLALIYGTAAPAGRLSSAMAAFAEAVSAEADVEVIDLSATPLPFAGTKPSDEMQADLDRVLATVDGADGVAIFSPIYRAAPPGALKNLLDLLPVEALENKPVALVSMGASPHHYLANAVSLGPVLDWFGAVALPGIYLTGKSFADGQPAPEGRTEIEDAARGLVETAQRLPGLRLLPRPLAAGTGG
jgi:FMN reductase